MSNSHLTQPRRPPGSPDAGQWASRTWQEASGDLSDWTANGGSYDYPPYLPKADDATRFWLQEVDIPEDVLKRVDDAYTFARVDDGEVAVEAWMQTSPRGRFAGADFEAERARIARTGLGGRPVRIPKVLIRPVVRVASLYFYAQDNLDEKTRTEICEHTTFDLPGQQPMTPSQIVATYDLARIRTAFDPGESQEVLEVRRLREDLSAEISALRNDLAE